MSECPEKKSFEDGLRERVLQRPADPAAVFELAHFVWSRNPTEAIEYFRKAAEMCPVAPDWQTGVNEQDYLHFLRTMDSQASLKWLRRSAYHAAGFVSYQIACQNGCLEAELNTIVAYFRKAIEVLPETASTDYGNIGGVYAECGEWKKAADEFRTALELSIEKGKKLPTNQLLGHGYVVARLSYDLAMCLEKLSKYEEAAELSLTAVRGDPENDCAWQILVNALQKLGRFEESERVEHLFKKRGKAYHPRPSPMELP